MSKQAFDALKVDSLYVEQWIVNSVGDYTSAPKAIVYDKAYADLFAGAPDLLAAVEAMIEWDARETDHAVGFKERLGLCHKAFELARAAYAKATGSAS